MQKPTAASASKAAIKPVAIKPVKPAAGAVAGPVRATPRPMPTQPQRATPPQRSLEPRREPEPRPRLRFRLSAKWIAALAAVMLIAILAPSFFSSPVPASLVLNSDRPTTVTAPGRVEAASGLRNLSFDVPGRIEKVFVEEGALVKAGGIIAQLENADAKAKVAAAHAEMSAAEMAVGITRRNTAAQILRAEAEVKRIGAELALLVAGPREEQIAEARAELAAAKAAAAIASEDEVRYHDPLGIYKNWSRQLYDQAHGKAQAAAAQLDAAAARLRELEAGTRSDELSRTRAMLEGAQAELARLKQTAPLEIDSSIARLGESKASVALAEAALEKTVLRAPIDGKVIWKFLHGGEVIDVMQRQPVASIADTRRLRVRASIDEADYPRVKAGDKASITADAFEGKSFAGHVDYVGSSAGEKPFVTGEPRERMDVRVIEALITLDDPAPFKLGLRVTVQFEGR